MRSLNQRCVGYAEIVIDLRNSRRKCGEIQIAPWVHWQIGGVVTIAFFSVIAGLACYAYCRITGPAFFKKQTLTRTTATLVPDLDVAGPAVAEGGQEGAPRPG